MVGYHFLPDDRRLNHGDKRRVRVGQTIDVDGDIICCNIGLHASPTPYEAAGYFKSGVITVVHCWGDFHVKGNDDKAAFRYRKVVRLAKVRTFLIRELTDSKRRVWREWYSTLREAEMDLAELDPEEVTEKVYEFFTDRRFNRLIKRALGMRRKPSRSSRKKKSIRKKG